MCYSIESSRLLMNKPSSIVLTPLLLLMSVFTYPGQHWNEHQTQLIKINWKQGNVNYTCTAFNDMHMCSTLSHICLNQADDHLVSSCRAWLNLGNKSLLFLTFTIKAPCLFLLKQSVVFGNAHKVMFPIYCSPMKHKRISVTCLIVNK